MRRAQNSEYAEALAYDEAVAAAEAAAAAPSSPPVLIAPYAAHCRLLLAQGTRCEVHTVDSFQGREADAVVLCLVRDGSRGAGFWSDARRLVVALTRARTRLVVVASRSLRDADEDTPLHRLVRALN